MYCLKEVPRIRWLEAASQGLPEVAPQEPVKMALREREWEWPVEAVPQQERREQPAKAARQVGQWRLWLVLPAAAPTELREPA